MPRPMAHRAAGPVRPRRSASRRSRRDGRGLRRFIGPIAIVVVGVVALVLVVRPADTARPLRTGEPAQREGAAVAAAATDAPGVARPAVPTAPPCEQGDVRAAHQAPVDWARTILDTRLMLTADFAPDDLVPVTNAGIDGRGTVRRLVIEDLRALADAARAAGVRVFVASAYRSYAQQQKSYASYVTGFGEAAARRTVARPGHSEHQLGTTVDIEGDLDWLAANAWRFGFVQSYPAARSPEHTCYREEAWHYRYVGAATAKAVRASGLSLREWLWQQEPG